MRLIPLQLALALATVFVAAEPARAQTSTCVWGCHCEGNGCGCNSNGSGSGCDTGGTGCMVTRCGKTIALQLAPDGTPVRLAAAAPGAPAGARAAGAPLRMRWEYVSQGRSAARHCSGVVIARYFDPVAAGAVRRRQHTVSI
ncbi:MAG TPA: hypothetical protein VGO40_11370 [Longimicrobium sp.]|jgi:hypothetical protein|nr:hypothetical protein [Longimicrobium sp.]